MQRLKGTSLEDKVVVVVVALLEGTVAWGIQGKEAVVDILEEEEVVGDIQVVVVVVVVEEDILVEQEVVAEEDILDLKEGPD